MAQRTWKFLSSILLVSIWLASPIGVGHAVEAKGQQQGTITTEVSFNQILAEISFDGEPYAASLAVTFTDPLVTLLPSSLVITATLIDPSDPTLRARLPEGLFIPGRFPVLIEITPNPALGLTFSGNYRLELETDNLEFDRLVPYRLLRAETGQDFEDMTRNLGIGSYRVRGLSGAFSEFVLAADLRSSKKVVESKIIQLRRLLKERAGDIDSSLLTDLEGKVDAIEQACLEGNFNAALNGVDALLAAIEQGVENQLLDNLFDLEEHCGSAARRGLVDSPDHGLGAPAGAAGDQCAHSAFSDAERSTSAGSGQPDRRPFDRSRRPFDPSFRHRSLGFGSARSPARRGVDPRAVSGLGQGDAGQCRRAGVSRRLDGRDRDQRFIFPARFLLPPLQGGDARLALS